MASTDEPRQLCHLWSNTQGLNLEGVSIETSRRWEMLDRASNDESTLRLQSLLDRTVYEKLVNHFIVARTKRWTTLRKEYWERQTAKTQCPHDDDDGDDLEFQHAIAMGRRERIGKEFYGFLDLPREIRDMIYEYLLVRGELYVPNDSGRIEHYEDDGGTLYKRYENADIDHLQMDPRRRRDSNSPSRGSLGLIMGVNHTVHAEATELFFGRNRIILPAGSFTLPVRFNLRFDSVSATGLDVRDTHPFNYSSLARDVSYTFDMRDHAVSDHHNLNYNLDIRDRIDVGLLEPREALLELHDQKTFQLELDWAERIDSIKEMKLDRLQLSFEECYCAVGCCRKVGWVLDRFLHCGPLPGLREDEHVWSSVDWKKRPPLVIEVIGWVSSKEQALIRDKLSRLASEEPIEVRLIEARPID